VSDHSETRERIIGEILARRVSAIIRTDDAGLARDAMKAAVRGGFRICEFTLTTPAALELVAEFSQDANLLVGAGTVLNAAEVRAAVDAGAKFIVSPVCDRDVIIEVKAYGLVSIPGCSTPTEMLTAYRAGADLIKLFPDPGDVVDTIRAIRGPMPFLRIFPTAGVTADNLVEVLKAGAVGAGFVRALFDPQDMASRNFAGIERRAADIIRRLPPR
jgi:Entner-Doudoroff aldolase